MLMFLIKIVMATLLITGMSSYFAIIPLYQRRLGLCCFATYTNATPTEVFFRTDDNSARSLVTISVNRRAVDPSIHRFSLLQELDIDVYALRFIPKENGVHYVTVKLKEAHIPGSPFPMLIGKMGADPALVLARGDGLDKGETGTRHEKLWCTRRMSSNLWSNSM